MLPTLEVVNSAPVDSASGEQSQECINSPDETGDLARDYLMNSFVKPMIRIWWASC
jgi:hypothetical protein